MTQVLENLSDELATTVETAGPAVVRVEARRRLPATGIVWSSDGVIVTAHHIVHREIFDLLGAEPACGSSLL